MDIVRGTVVRVIDGDTFELKIEEVGEYNKYPYGDVEKCRLDDVDAPEMSSRKGPKAKRRLEQSILGETIWLNVRTRGFYERLIVSIYEKDVKRLRISL